MPDADKGLRDETAASLKRMQDFDPRTLVREDELGKAYSFRGAVEPAQRLVDLYKRLTPLALEDFPQEQLNQVKTAANRDFVLFQQITGLDASQGLSPSSRDQRIMQIDQAYQPTFRELYPLIAFSMQRATDFQQSTATPARRCRRYGTRAPPSEGRWHPSRRKRRSRWRQLRRPLLSMA